jgi:hypothetical protein
VRRLQRLGHWLAGLGLGGFASPACQRVRWEVLHASCWDYFIHAGCKRHITPQGAGVATGPVKFVVGARRGLVGPGSRWKIGPLAHTFASVVGISMEPPVVGRDWSPVSSNKARGYCCRTSCRPPSPIAAEACSPAVFTCVSVHRKPAPGGPGSGWRQGRKRLLCQLPLLNSKPEGGKNTADERHDTRHTTVPTASSANDERGRAGRRLTKTQERQHPRKQGAGRRSGCSPYREISLATPTNKRLW